MMKKIFKFLGLFFLAKLVFLNIYIFASGKTYVYKAVIYNFADIDDYKIFDQAKISPSNEPDKWKIANTYNQTGVFDELNPIHEKLESVAFLVAVGDSIVEERYWQGYDSTSISNSFSMAKSIVSLLVGIAIDKKYIQSVDQPVGDFLEDFKVNGKEKITIKHLLSMSAGLSWDESYASPFSMTTEAYYGNDLYKTVSKLEAVEEPGIKFSYKSGDTEVLAMVLEKATGMKTSDFAQKMLWSKIGAEREAQWSLDQKGGIEKAYCCFYSNARDFARIGRLILNQGIWNGDTIVSPEYLMKALKPSELIHHKTGNKIDFYGWQFWLIPNHKGEDIVYCRGILGQYIICVPSKDAVIVRLGKKRGEKIGEAEHYAETFDMIEAVRKL
ncbi:MAG: serine hydrolase [Cytophagales bacterium]